MTQEKFSFYNRFLLSFTIFLILFLMLGAADALSIIHHSRHLFNTIGYRLSFIAHTLLIYAAVAWVATLFLTGLLSLLPHKSRETRGQWLGHNLAALFAFTIFFAAVWFYNAILFPKHDWLTVTSLLVTLILAAACFGIYLFLSTKLIQRSFAWLQNVGTLKTHVILLSTIAIAFLAGTGMDWLVIRSRRSIVQQTKPNILLISIDTLSAKHMGAYGYGVNTSPTIDSLAGQGIQFNHCYAQSCWTLPSHMSMLTGLYPATHGVILKAQSKLDTSVTTLTEVMKKNGYATMAFVDTRHDAFMGSDYGFNHGFDYYEHIPETLVHWERLKIGMLFYKLTYPFDPKLFYKIHQRKHADDVTERAVKWLNTFDRRTPFFMFLHIYDVHSTAYCDQPYLSPEPYQSMFAADAKVEFKGCDEKGNCASEFLATKNQQIRQGTVDPAFWTEDEVDKLISTYDGGVRHVDTQIGWFLKRFDQSGLSGNTLLILTSDHGEEFLEHSQFSHAQYYDESIQVPLVLSAPGLLPEKFKIDADVMLIDLMPTVLDFIDLPVPDPCQGQSLLPLLQADPDWRREYIYSGDDFEEKTGMVQSRAFKVIMNSQERQSWPFIKNQYEVYDRVHDNLESDNIALKVDPPDFKNYLRKIDEWRFTCDSLQTSLVSTKPAIEKPDQETLERLRSLGYIK